MTGQEKSFRKSGILENWCLNRSNVERLTGTIQILTSKTDPAIIGIFLKLVVDWSKEKVDWSIKLVSKIEQNLPVGVLTNTTRSSG